MASSRLITSYDGLRSADHSSMDMVHQVDNEDKDVYECGILSQSTCAVTDHQTHLLLKIMKTLSGARLPSTNVSMPRILTQYNLVTEDGWFV